MSKAIDVCCRIILGIVLLSYIIPSVRADMAIDPVPSYLFLSIIFTALFLLLSLGYLLRSRNNGKHKRIIQILTIVLITGLVLQSFYFITYKSSLEIWNENEESKPQFHYYIVNRTIDENKLSMYNSHAPMNVIYYNDSLIISYVRVDYHQNFSGYYRIFNLIIKNSNSTNEGELDYIVDSIGYESEMEDYTRKMGNVVLTEINGGLVCYYSILNYDLEGNNISKRVTSIDGVNWSTPEIIENYLPQVNYKDEISFPSMFEGYGFTNVGHYNVFKTSNNIYIMTVEFEEIGGDTISTRGTFLSYSINGDTWSEPIQLIEPFKLNDSVICETSLNHYAILYNTGYGLFDSEFTFDDLLNIRGPIIE